MDQQSYSPNTMFLSVPTFLKESYRASRDNPVALYIWPKLKGWFYGYVVFMVLNSLSGILVSYLQTQGVNPAALGTMGCLSGLVTLAGIIVAPIVYTPWAYRYAYSSNPDLATTLLTKREWIIGIWAPAFRFLYLSALISLALGVLSSLINILTGALEMSIDMLGVGFLIGTMIISPIINMLYVIAYYHAFSSTALRRMASLHLNHSIFPTAKRFYLPLITFFIWTVGAPMVLGCCGAIGAGVFRVDSGGAGIMVVVGILILAMILWLYSTRTLSLLSDESYLAEQFLFESEE